MSGGATPIMRCAQGLREIRVTRAGLILLASLWLVAVVNVPFWRAVWRFEGGLHFGNILFLLSAPLAVLAWTHVMLLALAWGRATKVVVSLVLVASAAATYFSHAYGTLLDSGMVANIVQTHAAETRDLVNPGLVGWLLFLGALPAALLARVPTKREPLIRELPRKAVHALAAMTCLAGALVPNYQHYASFLRNHRELRLMLVPHNIVAALHGYLKGRTARPAVLQAVGTDAARAPAAAAGGRPMLTVLVVGETARAQNFSLNGYPRATNPRLARQNVLSFRDVSACGTSTAVSLPCMFADLGRAHSDDGIAFRREGLLDVLQRAGIRVLWRDNNSGCKGVCARVPYEDMSAAPVAESCRDRNCYDDVLLSGLQAYLDALHDDALIVLHMNGSHGPAYFKRYPPTSETFTPACHSAELSRCSRESIVNAYDNSIRYTDHVLSGTIDLLRENAGRFDTALLYVSDHGESLGEHGLYLHGIPYALAPGEQRHVPMLVWLSDGITARLGLDRTCLAAHQDDRLSHDNLFHSVLGLSQVRTETYVAALDIFRPCRS